MGLFLSEWVGIGIRDKLSGACIFPCGGFTGVPRSPARPSAYLLIKRNAVHSFYYFFVKLRVFVKRALPGLRAR